MKVGMKVLVKRVISGRETQWRVAEVNFIGRKYFGLKPDFGYEKYKLDGLTPVSKYTTNVEVFLDPTQAVDLETRKAARKELYQLGVELSWHKKFDTNVMIALLNVFPDEAKRVHKEMQELLDKFNAMLLE